MDVYLDYAATSPLRAEVLEAMLPALNETFGNPDSLHGYGRRAAALVTGARDKVAGLLGVRPSEVYFTAGGTEADNWAVRCLGEGGVVASSVEHAAVLSACALRGGKTCDVGHGGLVDMTSLEHTMSESDGLLAVMGVNNEVGCIQPIAELAEFAHARGAYLFADCVQAACSQDLAKILRHADAISLSAHKLGGPKGTGALIVKKGVPMRPLIAGGEQERGMRGGTSNVAGIVGFAEALGLAVAEREEFCRHTGKLRALFEGRILAELGGGATADGENRAPNISHLTFAKGGPHLLNLLDLKGVAASGGAACSAHDPKPSHVLIAMGRSPGEAAKGVRFSFGRETTEEEVRFAADAVVACLR